MIILNIQSRSQRIIVVFPDSFNKLSRPAQHIKTALFLVQFTGAFIQQVFDFTIVAFAMFLLVKVINKIRRSVEAEKAVEAPKPTNQEVLLSEIRDLLKSR